MNSIKDNSKLTIGIVLGRILAFPFVACLCLIGVIFLYCKYMGNYVKYGGETIAYTRSTQRKTIQDVFEKLVEQDNNKTT